MQTVPGAGTPHVEFGMYDFASVRWAWDDLWAAVHSLVPWTPPELTRSGDVHARWSDPDCVVTHVCGWPFVARHLSDMDLVGSFAIDLPEAEPPAHYRSVLVSRRELGDPVGVGVHAAANSADSLSGWHSLRAATVGPGTAWRGTVTFTGAHHDSLRALASGDADLACIDSWSLALISAEEPELVRGLHRVGVGPRIPTPAITARRSLGADRVGELRRAFADALADPATEASRTALHIVGFEATTVDDYLAVLLLGDGA